MDRVQKIDCGVNGEVIFTGATAKFQLKKGLTLIDCSFSYASNAFLTFIIAQMTPIIVEREA